jgi:hypothetical protein
MAFFDPFMVGVEQYQDEVFFIPAVYIPEPKVYHCSKCGNSGKIGNTLAQRFFLQGRTAFALVEYVGFFSDPDTVEVRCVNCGNTISTLKMKKNKFSEVEAPRQLTPDEIARDNERQRKAALRP